MKDIELIYKDALVRDDEIKNTADGLSRYIQHILNVSEASGITEEGIRYDEAESSVNLPFDSNLYKDVAGVAERVRTKNLKYIIIVGVGGSNLGAKAIYDAMRGTIDPFLHENTPKIIFADTTSPKLLEDIRAIIEQNISTPDEVLLNVISKSGTTTETIANFETIYSFLGGKFGDVAHRVVVTTDNGSALWKHAEEKGFELLSVPEKVGGRYSVFSSVGLLPLMLSGVDIEKLLDGAQAMHKRCLVGNIEENPALLSAVLIYINNQKGISINNNFFFNPHMESVGRWYRQLIGESIGKRFAIDGGEVNAGITPIVSIGSTDLHSMAQLYFGGPKDKFTTFVYAPGNSEELVVPKDLVFPDLVEGVEGKELADIMAAILSGVKESYKKNELPFVEIIMHGINEHSLGQFMQFKMIEIMYLAQLLGVNAFNQPDVEDYKKETKRILREGV